MNKYRVRMSHARSCTEKMIDVVAINPGVAAIEALLKNPHFSVLGVQWLKPEEPLNTASTAHVDRSGASVKMDNGSTMHFTGGAADPLKSADMGNRRFFVIPKLVQSDAAPGVRLVLEPWDDAKLCEWLAAHISENASEATTDPRDEFEAAYTATQRPHITLEFLRTRRREDGGYLPGLHFLNGAWLGWKLARGIK